MKRPLASLAPATLALLVGLAATTTPLSAEWRLNEIRIDDPGPDDYEYVELFTTAAGGTETLASLTLVVIGDGAGSGTLERVIPLPAVDAGPFFLVASLDPTLDGVTPDLVAEFGPNFLENSDNLTVALVQDFTGAEGDDLDIDDDGTLDFQPWAEVIDAVGLLEETTVPPVETEWEYASFLGFPTVGPDGTFVPGHSFRDEDGVGTWQVGIFQVDSPDALDSPRATNRPTDELAVVLSAQTVAEGAGTTVTGTVTRTGPTDVPLDVTVTIADTELAPDPSELSAQSIVVIPAGESSAEFLADVRDDTWPDGDQVVVVTVSAPGLVAGSTTLTVTDDDTAADFSVVINEVYPAVLEDANGDSFIDAGAFPNPDEFIELVNVSAAAIDLSGWTIADRFVDAATNGQPIHTFPAGTVLAPGCAVVVFGRGIVNEGPDLAFGGAIVQNAGNGQGLYLDDGGERLRVSDASGTEVHALTTPATDGFDGSFTFAIDGDPGSPLVLHFVEFGESFSPGRANDGSPFCDLPSALALTIADLEIAEDQGPGATSATVRRTGSLTGDLVVVLESSDPGEAIVPPSVTIPDGDVSANFDIDAIDDSGPDGTQTVTITASADGYVSASATVDVVDDGTDTAFDGLVINEVDSDQPGAEDGEFVEFFNPSGSAQSLDGLVLVLFNGNDMTTPPNAAYFAVDLTGTVAAGGFFVVGDGTVPRIDQVVPEFSLQNGADAVALFVGSAAAFTTSGPEATPANALPFEVNLVDALVYGTDDPVDDLVDILTPGQPQANEGPANNETSVARLPDGGTQLVTGTFAARAPTPGATNGTPGESGYFLWAAMFPTLTGGPLDDDDGDGLANQVEYGLGLDPTVFDADQVAAPTVDETNRLVWTLRKGSQAAADPLADYSVEASSELGPGTWTTEGVTVIRDDSTTLSVAVDLANGPVQFLRMRFTLASAP